MTHLRKLLQKLIRVHLQDYRRSLTSLITFANVSCLKEHAFDYSVNFAAYIAHFLASFGSYSLSNQLFEILTSLRTNINKEFDDNFLRQRFTMSNINKYVLSVRVVVYSFLHGVCGLLFVDESR